MYFQSLQHKKYLQYEGKILRDSLTFHGMTHIKMQTQTLSQKSF